MRSFILEYLIFADQQREDGDLVAKTFCIFFLGNAERNRVMTFFKILERDRIASAAIALAGFIPCGNDLCFFAVQRQLDHAGILIGNIIKTEVSAVKFIGKLASDAVCGYVMRETPLEGLIDKMPSLSMIDKVAHFDKLAIGDGFFFAIRSGNGSCCQGAFPRASG